MASDAIAKTDDESTRIQAQLLSGRRMRQLRENFTAYLFLAPAIILIFTFGIFPVFYAAYVSLYRWRIRQGEFQGLKNFVDAMGDIAYLLFFAVALALFAFVIVTAVRMFRSAKEKEVPFSFLFLSLIPGGLLATGLALFLLRCITFFAMDIAIERGDARVLGSLGWGALLMVLGLVVSTYVQRLQHRVAARSAYTILPNFTGSAMVVVLLSSIAIVITRFTWVELNASERYEAAISRIGLVIAGLLLLAAAYAIWRWAMMQHSNLKTLGGILAAAALIGAGLFFALNWSTMSADADADFYNSLKITVFFSAGTVPIQLAIAVFLAYLLFQDVRGKALFRVIFFIPYMAPSVAAAGIFQVLFSARAESMANRLLTFLSFGNAEPLSWLQESKAAISILGQAFGLDSFAGIGFGPSLALIVIILYSIWVYVGYNTVIFLAGLGNIPGSLYEAAEIDGAGRWALFRHITLPLLSPITFLLSVLAVIGTFKAFNSIWVLRDNAALGTTDTASIYFFETFFRGSRFGYATSMAMVLFIIILTMTLIQNQVAEKRVHYG
ncbi:MAG: sugar ABC transporter permease [Ardenticatenales bacterium]|nr:sugar ABC transporter permease [Ardenticatenales bacterium]